MTISRRGLSSLVKVVLLMLIRSKTILILVLSISIPIAMATAISLSTTLLHEQAKAIAELMQPKSSIVLTNTLSRTLYENCVTVGIVYTHAIYNNYSFYVQVHIVREFNRYADVLNIRLISKSKLQNDILSIGEALASKYGVDVGKPITICLPKQCYNSTIQAIHRGPGFFNYIVITNANITYDSDAKYICLGDTNYAFIGILQSISRDTERVLSFLSIVIPLSYMLIVFIAVNRVVNNYRDDIALIISLGISRRRLVLCFISVLISIVCILALYGIALGVVVFHLSLWILKFIGIPIFVRPLPLTSLTILLSSTYIPVITLSLVLTFTRLGEET